MKITYHQLIKYLHELHTDQLNATVTIEIDGECFGGVEFRICDNNHDSLETNHPVLLVTCNTKNMSDEMVKNHIDKIEKSKGFGPIQVEE